MAAEENSVAFGPPLNEVTKGVFGARPQRTMTDFSALAVERNERMTAVLPPDLEIGNQNAAAGFIAACDRFETLRGVQTKQPVSAEPRKEPAAQTKKSVSVEPRKEPAAQSAKPQSERKARRREFLDLVRRAAAKAKRHDGWINISELGSEIRKLNPGDVMRHDLYHDRDSMRIRLVGGNPVIDRERVHPVQGMGVYRLGARLVEGGTPHLAI